MREPVHHHVIVGAHQRLDDAEARRPAGWIEHGVLRAGQIGHRALESERVRRVADESGGAGAVHAEGVDRRLGGILDRGMRGQVQVILRAEIDAGKALAGILDGGAGGVGRLLGGAGIRPEMVLPAQILPAEEVLHASQQIGAPEVAIVAQAAGQSLGRYHLLTLVRHRVFAFRRENAFSAAAIFAISRRPFPSRPGAPINERVHGRRRRC